jgi:hypothetical protein
MHGFKAGCVAIVGGLLVACSDGGSHSTSDAGSPGATLIGAAHGGIVTSGDITLTIPAGALATDTEITLKVVPKYSEALVGVGQFGPDGLVFAKPATLAIKAASTLAAAGDTLVIGLDDGGTFTPVQGSTSQNDVVSAPIEHFTSYSVMAYRRPPTIRCDNSLQLSLVPSTDPSATEMVYTGLNIAVPNFFKDNVLITSCDPPLLVNHLTGTGSVTIPYCLAVCAATGQLAVVSSAAAIATVAYGTNICGGFFTPAEDLTIPADILVPLSGCQ